MGGDRRGVLMRKWLIFPTALLVVLWAASSSAFWHGTTLQSVQALQAKPLLKSLGFNTHVSQNGTTSSTILTDTAYMGVNNIRDYAINSGVQSTYDTVAAGGGLFDALSLTSATACTGTSAATIISAILSELDTFVTSYPGANPFVEGPNEINNQSVCYLITASASGASGTTINLTTPASVLSVVNTPSYFSAPGYPAGPAPVSWLVGEVVVTDVTTPGNIPGGTTLVGATSGSVTLSASATVSASDVIQFEVNGTIPAAAIMWQSDLADAVRADGTLAGVKMMNFTSSVAFGTVGNADYNNLHFYPGVQPGATNSQWSLVGQYVDGVGILGIPLVVTETGWYTMPDGAGGIDELTQARYYLNDIFDLYTLYSVPQIYFYELLDERCDPGNTDPQVHYGMFDCNNNPKTAATALQNLTTILADSGGAFSPGRLTYSLSGMPPSSGTYPTGSAGSYSALLEKSNGHFEIVLWNEASIYDTATNTEIMPPTSNVVLDLGTTATTVNVYDPITGSSPTNTYSSTKSITIPLAADPQIVEVIP